MKKMRKTFLILVFFSVVHLSFSNKNLLTPKVFGENFESTFDVFEDNSTFVIVLKELRYLNIFANIYYSVLMKLPMSFYIH